MRNQSVDIFRIILCIWIILFHYTTRYDALIGHEVPFDIFFTHGGYYGVVMFFVISGYFVPQSLDRLGGAIDSVKWLYRKVVRLYPAYLVAVPLIYLICSYSEFAQFKVSFVTYVVNQFLIYHPKVRFVEGAHWYIAALFLFNLFSIVLYNLRFFKFKYSWIFVVLLVMLLHLLWMRYPDNMVLLKIGQWTFTPYYLAYLAGIFIKKHQNDKSIVFLLLVLLYVVFDIYISRSIYLVVLMPVFYYLTYKATVQHDVLTFKSSHISNTISYISACTYAWYLIHQRIGYVIIHELERVCSSEFVILIVHIISTFIIAVLIHQFEVWFSRKIIQR